jgi:hypothetical protein
MLQKSKKIFKNSKRFHTHIFFSLFSSGQLGNSCFMLRKQNVMQAQSGNVIVCPLAYVYIVYITNMISRIFACKTPEIYFRYLSFLN